MASEKVLERAKTLDFILRELGNHGSGRGEWGSEGWSEDGSDLLYILRITLVGNVSHTKQEWDGSDQLRVKNQRFFCLLFSFELSGDLDFNQVDVQHCRKYWALHILYHPLSVASTRENRTRESHASFQNHPLLC